MSRPRLHPALLLAGAAGLLLGVVLGAPYVTRSGLEGEQLQFAVARLHRPRALFGAVAGFGLALSGVVLQAVLRNPLASPYTLGIAGGAAVGAVAALLAGGTAGAAVAGGAATAPLSASGGALLGALVAALGVYAVASLREHAAETLLLAGVAISLFSSAAITMLYYQAAQRQTLDLHAIVRWSMGDLDVVGYQEVGACAALVALGSLLLIPLIGKLDVASLDDDSARGLGVDPTRVRRLAFVGTSVVSAGVVAYAGPVGFVGLVVPHAVRPFSGPDPRLLLPASAMVGGAFLVACDLLARTLVYPAGLPINVVTYAIGCPAFVWILVRRRGV